MASNTASLPMEVKELVIDELDIDGSSDDAKSGRTALRSCLFVSRHFHECARSRLFRNIELRDIYKKNHIFQNRLILLHQLLTTSINDQDPGIASNIKKLTISVPFEDLDAESDDEIEGGGDQDTIAMLVAKHLPTILRLVRRDAHRLENLVIEDRSSWAGSGWASPSQELHLALWGLLSMGTLRRLEFRNFSGVPNNLFDGTHITHLTVYNLTSMHPELGIEESTSVPPFLKEITFCPLEFLDTDQSFPLGRIVDISSHQTPNTSQTKLLKKIKIQIHNKFDLANVVDLLRAAYLAEDLHVNFMSLDGLGSNPSLNTNLDLFPLQKLTHLTMLYHPSAESGPESLEIAYSILKSSSCSIMYLTLDISFELAYNIRTPDYLIYPRQDHWEPIDNILAGPHYPKLRQLVLRITLCWDAMVKRSTALDNSKNRFKAALPRLSASNRLSVYLV